MLEVRNLKSPRTGREVANQFIIRDRSRNVVLFQSYESPIIEINYDDKAITIFRDYKYSMTTGKYRNSFFIDEGFYDLSNLKDLDYYIKVGTYKEFEIIKSR